MISLALLGCKVVCQSCLAQGLVLTRLCNDSYLSGYKAWYFVQYFRRIRCCSCLHHIFSPQQEVAAIKMGKESISKLIFIGLQCCVSLYYGKVNQLYIHIYPLFWISFPFRSPQSTELSSLSCTVLSLYCLFYAECQ